MNTCKSCKYWIRGKRLTWDDGSHSSVYDYYGEIPDFISRTYVITQADTPLDKGLCIHPRMNGYELSPEGIDWFYSEEPRPKGLTTHIKFGCVNWGE